MLGPRGLTTELRDAYLSYLFSANPIGIYNPQLRAALEEELSQRDRLCRGPILELDPASRRAETVAELVNEGTLGDAFVALPHRKIADISARRLYRHQVDAIRASAGGRSIVVASGTGSGKTECWLYPALDAIAADAGPGLRAIVLYPMNALADDQRRDRLRSAIGGASITYGEFTGNTRGDVDPAAPVNELQTREQMRRTPPNILITNPSMLEYLLLRPEDAALFRGARLQFLIIDEAHTYRGAYAIELAHLLRRLKARLGLQQGSVRAFVLSATIEQDREQIAEFASALTGETVRPADVFFGEPEAIPNPGVVFVPPATYECFTRDVLDAIVEDPIRILDVSGIIAFGEERVHRAAAAPNGSRALWELLHEDGHVAALRLAISGGPCDIGELCAQIFGPHDGNVDETLGRLVDAAALAREDEDASPLLPARFHVFLRGLDGLSVCFNPEHGAIGDGPYRIGTWHTTERIDCDCGARVWDLLTCQECAAWYIKEPAAGRERDDERGPENAYLLVHDVSETDDEESYVDDERCMVCRRQGEACACTRPAKRHTVAAGSRRTCLVCASRRVGRVMTGAMAPTQILAEELTQRQDPDNRKLLVFSDSRANAAEFAAQLSRAMRQHADRAAIYHALRDRRTFEAAVGFERGASLVKQRLQAAKALDVSPDSLYKARGVLFAEFTSSYATRRRTGSLGLLASEIEFTTPPPAELVALFPMDGDARVVTQSLLEIMQYDSAVTHPTDMELPSDDQLARRGDVRYGLSSGDKHFLPKGQTRAQRLAHRPFNLATRLVGEEKAESLLRRVWDYAAADGVLVGSAAGETRQIDAKRVGIYAPERWFRCTDCRRLTIWALSDGRGCQTKNCAGNLISDPSPVDVKDHYTRNIVECAELLVVQEHTAQLESRKGRDVGERFRNGGINILSCSTTFELGVDIGTLQSVFMRNVPPTVANYRQRAGRAGRSRRAPAYLVTYCGPNPHDRVFFRNPAEIIVGAVPIPRFNVLNRQLGVRHVNSFLFAPLWMSARIKTGEMLTQAQDLFSELVLAYLDEWAAAARGSLRNEFGLYRGQVGSSLGTLDAEIDRFVRTFREEAQRYDARCQELRALMADRRSRVHADRELVRLERRWIVDHLTARAFLPGYAFPIYTVELRTTDADVNLQRDLRIAINEYAPGNQVVADNKLFSSIAVALRGPTAAAPTPFNEIWACGACETVYQTASDSCTCGSDEVDHFAYVIPDGFLSDMTMSPREAIARAKREPAKVRQYVFAPIGQANAELHFGPIVARTFRDTEFMFVNRGRSATKHAFLLCESCGKELPRAGSHKTAFGKECRGTARRTALAHRVLGEAMSIAFASTADFIVPDDKAFRNTLLYALVGGIARSLAIEDRDLGGQVRRAVGTTASWEIVVVDNVPGGAGYVDQMCSEEALRRALAEAERIVDCECDPETTCYGCVNTLWNQHLHGEMRRGPVLTFLRALQVRLAGRPVLFGIAVRSWLEQHGADASELVLASPAFDDVLLSRIKGLAATSRVTLVVPEDQSYDEKVRLSAWTTIWGDCVSVQRGAVTSTVVATRSFGGSWSAVEDKHSTVLREDTFLDGAEVIGGVEAAEIVRAIRSGPAWISNVGAAECLAFSKGMQTSESEQFGHLFTTSVKRLVIEDRYVVNEHDAARVAAWAALPHNRDLEVVVITVRNRDNAIAQERMLFALRAKLRESGRALRWELRPHRETRHDRRVVVEFWDDDKAVTIVLPFGIDFIDINGRVRDDTHAFIFRNVDSVGVLA